ALRSRAGPEQPQVTERVFRRNTRSPTEPKRDDAPSYAPDRYPGDRGLWRTVDHRAPPSATHLRGRRPRQAHPAPEDRAARGAMARRKLHGARRFRLPDRDPLGRFPGGWWHHHLG